MNDLLFELDDDIITNMENVHKIGLIDMALKEPFWKNRDPNYTHLTQNRLKKAIESGYKHLYKSNFIVWKEKVYLIKSNSMLSVVLYHPVYQYMKVSSHLKETLCYDANPFDKRVSKRIRDYGSDDYQPQNKRFHNKRNSND